jgi:hypothetical protein
MTAGVKSTCHSPVSLEERIVKALMAGGLFFGLLIFFAVPPGDFPFGCAFHAITGHSCLTCGITRSLHAISHGELAAAFRYHLFGPALFLGIFLCIWLFIWEAVSGKRTRIYLNRNSKIRGVMMVAVVWLVYWGVRLVSEIN